MVVMSLSRDRDFMDDRCKRERDNKLSFSQVLVRKWREKVSTDFLLLPDTSRKCFRVSVDHKLSTKLTNQKEMLSIIDFTDICNVSRSLGRRALGVPCVLAVEKADWQYGAPNQNFMRKTNTRQIRLINNVRCRTNFISNLMSIRQWCCTMITV
jgi:hypothetical protein